MDTEPIDEARQAMQQGDKPAARNLLRQVLQQNVQDLEAWLLLAELAEQDNQKIICLQQALRVDPENARAGQWLAELQATAQADEAAGESDPLPPAGNAAESKPDNGAWTDKTCPYIGLEQDRASFTSFPSSINFCYRLQPAKPISHAYQAACCLTEKYPRCKLLQERPDKPPEHKSRFHWGKKGK